MKRTFAKMFVMTRGQLIGFGVVIGLVGCIQWGIHSVVTSYTVIARDTACVAKSFESMDRAVVMKLDCSGDADETVGSRFIAAYLQSPGPFTCTRYAWAYAVCKMPKAEPRT